jgi:hypothetical protein
MASREFFVSMRNVRWLERSMLRNALMDDCPVLLQGRG